MSSRVVCSLSRLSIPYGTPVRAFILAELEGDKSLPLYTTSYYAPLTTGLAGTYDEYRKLKNVQPSENFELACKHFFPQLKHEDLFDCSTSKTVSLRHYRTDLKCAVNVMFVREDIYQEVLKLSGFSKITKEDIVSELEELKEAIALAKEISDDSGKKEPAKKIPWPGFVSDHIQFDLKLGALFKRQGFSDLLPSALSPYQEHLAVLLETNPVTDDKVIRFAQEMLEHLSLDKMMQELSIYWQPAADLADEASYDMARAFNRAVHHICVTEIRTQKAEARADRDEEKRTHPAAKKLSTPIQPK